MGQRDRQRAKAVEDKNEEGQSRVRCGSLGGKGERRGGRRARAAPKH